MSWLDILDRDRPTTGLLAARMPPAGTKGSVEGEQATRGGPGSRRLGGRPLVCFLALGLVQQAAQDVLLHTIRLSRLRGVFHAPTSHQGGAHGTPLLSGCGGCAGRPFAARSPAADSVGAGPAAGWFQAARGTGA